MEFIRNTKVTFNKSGGRIQWAIFKCPYCLQEVERQKSNGLIQKSCGCASFLLQSKAFSGKNNPMYGKTGDKHPLYGKVGVNKGKKFTEKTRQKMRDKALGRKSSEETRQKISLANTGKKRTEEQKKEQSKRQKDKKFTEERKQNISKGNKGKSRGKLEKNSNWQGGKSFEEYPQEFFSIRKLILERDEYKCQDPNCEHLSDILDCHHIDYDKKNNNPANLIILCKKCHMKTYPKNKRKHYTEFYQTIMMGKVMECLL